MVSAWFSDRRGLALGALMAGLGACGVLIPYLANYLLDMIGWRGTFLVIGALCAVIPTAVYAPVTKMPVEHERERAAAGRTAGESLRRIATSSRQFWMLSAAIFLVSTATF
ncbi:putative major facilitator superfamily transporter [Gordonia polyisoprenivorans NBRC 16320 = JCM 10675]|nr:MFS transporter [Gordonia polyisoprenivorans]GAB26360.1 putative major facilitator superfamily transporter [Gordonia polyisoprenivorans NBRC 16320 = JCM 10675]